MGCEGGAPMRSLIACKCKSKAMVKAMLNSHLADSNGYCTLFSASDFSSLGPLGKNRALATEAHSWLHGASQFLRAYSSLDSTQINKLLSTMAVRCVMCVHGKKAEARQNFSSLIDVATAFHAEAKKADNRLPSWNKLPTTSPEESPAPAKGGIREINAHDGPSDSILLEKDFKLNAVVCSKSEPTKCFRIISISADSVSLAACDSAPSLTSAQPKGKSKGKKAKQVVQDLQVSRFELVESWKAHTVTPIKAIVCPDPLDNTELRNALLGAAVKSAMAIEVSKSSESDCTLQVQPDAVIADKDYKKPGTLKLHMLTNNIIIQASSGRTNTTGLPCIGSVVGSNPQLLIYAKCSNSMPGGVRDTFISKYWCTRSTWAAHETNSIYETKDVSVQVPALHVQVKLQVPWITNSSAIAKGDEIVVLKQIAGEPEPKRVRSK